MRKSVSSRQIDVSTVRLHLAEMWEDAARVAKTQALWHLRNDRPDSGLRALKLAEAFMWRAAGDCAKIGLP